MPGQPKAEPLRELAPKVLSTLLHKYRDFDACEDAVQEALLAAHLEWSPGHTPENPYGWLLTVASRRLIEIWRRDSSRRQREGSVSAVSTLGPGEISGVDDTLDLLFLCCHPALNASAQAALTLRAVGGLTTAEIARAFLVPDSTMAQRISRAKQRIRASGSRFEISPGSRSGRLPVVLQVLYLIFTEGHTASSGHQVHRIELTREAIRLTRQLLHHLPDDGEVAGLLALMLLTEARHQARSPDGSSLVPLAEQDRSLWDAASMAEGVSLINASLSNKPLGPYQIQAAIAAVHDEAANAAETDWAEILVLYDLLMVLSPGPAAALNRTVALAMVDGAAAGLRTLEWVEAQYGLSALHRVDAVRAHLLEMAGDVQAAQEHYRKAAQRTSSVPEQQYLSTKARTLAASSIRRPPLP